MVVNRCSTGRINGAGWCMWERGKGTTSAASFWWIARKKKKKSTQQWEIKASACISPLSWCSALGWLFRPTIQSYHCWEGAQGAQLLWGSGSQSVLKMLYVEGRVLSTTRGLFLIGLGLRKEISDFKIALQFCSAFLLFMTPTCCRNCVLFQIETDRQT